MKELKTQHTGVGGGEARELNTPQPPNGIPKYQQLTEAPHTALSPYSGEPRRGCETWMLCEHLFWNCWTDCIRRQNQSLIHSHCQSDFMVVFFILVAIFKTYFHGNKFKNIFGCRASSILRTRKTHVAFSYQRSPPMGERLWRQWRREGEPLRPSPTPGCMREIASAFFLNFSKIQPCYWKFFFP